MKLKPRLKLPVSLMELHNLVVNSSLSEKEIAEKLNVTIAQFKGYKSSYNIYLKKNVDLTEIENLRNRCSKEEISLLLGYPISKIEGECQFTKKIISIDEFKRMCKMYENKYTITDEYKLMKEYIGTLPKTPFKNIDTSKLSRDFIKFPLEFNGRFYEPISKEDLYELEMVQHIYSDIIEEYFGVSKEVITLAKRKYGIKARDDEKYRELNKEELKELYLDQNKPINEVAEILKTTRHNVINHINLYDLHKTAKQRLQIAAQTNIKRYGCVNVFQSQEIKEKSQQTMKKRYGKRYQQTDEYKAKVKATKKERYGSENYVNIEKIHQTNMERYGVPCLGMNPNLEIYRILEDKDRLVALIKKNGYLGARDFARKEHVKEGRVQAAFRKFDLYYLFDYKTSAMEQELTDLLKSYDNQAHKTKLSDNKEIDVYSDKFKLGIEANGNYWHAEGQHTNDYHLNKSLLAKQEGFFLFHVFEFEWQWRKEIVLNHLKCRLGGITNKIYARKCQIKTVNEDVAKEFFKNNCIVDIEPANLFYGLYYNDELCLVICLNIDGRRGNFINNLAGKLNTIVVGGVSKLIKHLQKRYKELIIDIPIDKFDGHSLKYCGFEFQKRIPPKHHYVKYKYVYFERHFKYEDMIADGLEGTDVKNVLDNYQFCKIYNCGYNRFVWKRA